MNIKSNAIIAIKIYTKRVIYIIMCILNRFIIKDKHLIFMDDVDLIRYNELALLQYLFDNGYLLNNKIIYYTKIKKCAEIKYKLCSNIHFVNNLFLALMYRLKAKYVFSELVGNIFACKPYKGQICISLWHGMALKTIGLTKKNIYLSNSFTYMLCYSDYAATIMKKDWNFDDSKVLISQNPRNDLLFLDSYCYTEFNINTNFHSILWLPTFRKNTKSNYIDSNIDFPLLDKYLIYKLDKYLCEVKANLIIKLHPLQNEIEFLNGEFNNIYIINTNDFHHTKCEFYEFIGQSDALISDYSSVAIDYMLIDKPIGYVLDDINEYALTRGFHVDNPLKLMPGHHIYNYNDLKQFIYDVSHNIDKYKVDRRNVSRFINKYNDNCNCKRVVKVSGIHK